jgi:hypothetical protein
MNTSEPAIHHTTGSRAFAGALVVTVTEVGSVVAAVTAGAWGGDGDGAGVGGCSADVNTASVSGSAVTIRAFRISLARI